MKFREALMNIKDTILQRNSVRTYKEEPVLDKIKQNIKNHISGIVAPFNTKMRFELVDIAKSDSNLKLGTYGVISGASTFICAATEKTDRYEENLGYAFENIILYITSVGLGTCWLGGTFKRSEFGKAIGLNEKELLPIISPIGYAKEKRGLVDSLMVMAAGSNNRKGWGELFFDKNFDNPLKKEESPETQEIFDMVRLAPSASNKQPWRIVKDGDIFHFFLARNAGYGNIASFDIQRLDIGIAMFHFESMAKELGLPGKWIDNNPGLNVAGNIEYIISYDISA
jgi:nitroreductase